MNKTNLLVIVAFLLTFGVGAIAGYMVGRESAAPATEKTEEQVDRERDGRHQNGERQRQRMREWMTRQLELEEHQQDEFFRILLDSRERTNEIMQHYRAESRQMVEEEADRTIEKLSEVLTEEQLEQFVSRFSYRAMQERRRQQNHQNDRRLQRR